MKKRKGSKSCLKSTIIASPDTIENNYCNIPTPNKSPPNVGASSEPIVVTRNLVKKSSATSSDSRKPLPRPSVSYAYLITEAIQKSPGKQLILSDIYRFIEDNYPYFRTAETGWKNSIRHNLSLNKSFKKVPRIQKSGSGKGSYWCLAENSSYSHSNANDMLRRRSFPTYFERYPIPPFNIEKRMRHKSDSGTQLPALCPKPNADLSVFYQPLPIPQVLIPFDIEAGNSNENSFSNVPFEQSDNSFSQGDPSQGDLSLQEQVLKSNIFYNDVWLGAGTPKSDFEPNDGMPAAYSELTWQPSHVTSRKPVRESPLKSEDDQKLYASYPFPF